MEIETAPRHPAPTPWGRLLLCLVLFAPVTLLVLLPIGLGLDRYVITGSSMDGGVDRGSIAFERVVPLSDLRLGDVITYPDPDVEAAEGALVTHRIVALEPEGIRTQGDAEAAVDPWVLRPGSATMSRVEFTVPWIGWAYLLLLRGQGWVLTAVSAAVLAALLTGRMRRPGSHRGRNHEQSRRAPLPSPYAPCHGATGPSGGGRRGHRLSSRPHTRT